MVIMTVLFSVFHHSTGDYSKLALHSPPTLLHVAVGAGLPSTLQTREMVSFATAEKSVSGTVPVMLAGADNKKNRDFTSGE